MAERFFFSAPFHELFGVPQGFRGTRSPESMRPILARVPPGDLWLLGPHRVLCGDATSAEAVARLLVTDPPYGIELDLEWRDRAGLNGCGPAEPSYLKKRTAGHTEATISGDTRAGRPTSGTLRNSRGRCWTGCCGLALSITSKSSGTKAAPCPRGHFTGFNTSRAGLSASRKHPGTARLARTPRSGSRRRRSSSWKDPTRTSLTTQRKSPLT